MVKLIYEDGTWEDLEVEKNITILDFSNRNIRRITGLEELINLEGLNCNRNNICEAELNLNNNIKLECLICDNNNLCEAELNLNNNINLERLFCYSNNISELNINNNKKLRYLFCNDNNICEAELKCLDKTELSGLYCRNNPMKVITGTNINDNKDLYVKKYKSLNIIQRLYKRRYWKRYRKAIIIQMWIMGIGNNPYNKNCIFVRMSMIKSGIKEEDAKDIIFINSLFN